MAKTYREYTSNGTSTLFDVSFDLGFLSRSQIFVYAGDVNAEGGYDNQLSYTWPNSSQIELTTPLPSGDKLTIRRVVDGANLYSTYVGKSIFKKETLENNFLQALMLLEEVADGLLLVNNAGEIDFLYDLDMNGSSIRNLANGEDSGDAINLSQLTTYETSIREDFAAADAIIQRQIDDVVEPEFSTQVELNGVPYPSTDLGVISDPVTNVPDGKTIKEAIVLLNAAFDSYATAADLDSVESTANSAATDAASALSTANSANTKADTAIADAALAQSTADDVQRSLSRKANKGGDPTETYQVKESTGGGDAATVNQVNAVGGVVVNALDSIQGGLSVNALNRPTVNSATMTFRTLKMASNVYVLYGNIGIDLTGTGFEQGIDAFELTVDIADIDFFPSSVSKGNYNVQATPQITANVPLNINVPSTYTREDNRSANSFNICCESGTVGITGFAITIIAYD